MDLLFVLIFILCIVLFVLYRKQVRVRRTVERKSKKLDAELEKYRPIIDIEEELKVKKDECEAADAQTKEAVEMREAEERFMKDIKSQIKVYEADLDIIHVGLYAPVFDLDTSDDYKSKLTEIREKQKELVKDGNAAICGVDWQVGGSAKKGETYIKRHIKLTLRAFNGECDSLISKVKWNNVASAEGRIKKSFDIINKLGELYSISITEVYLQLKLDELHLAYELEQKRYDEKEEQRQIREQMREEERAQREIEKAKQEAEKEERRQREALEAAKKELEKATGEELDTLNAEIEKLQAQLQEAHEATERAISRAQLTKSGHVYVISNIGSFGEEVYKIGMTRRLEPMDRVKELGDASVPFQFDVHAMIYSEDAPGLESTLHRAFDEKRVNMINQRKEFFKASLDDIEAIVKENTDGEFHLTKIAEAKEYRETLSLLQSRNGDKEAASRVDEELPEELII